MIIRVSNAQRKVVINLPKIIRIAKSVLRQLHIRDDAELSLMFVNDARIRRLNRCYRGENRATDVLAFSLHKKRERWLNPGLLGDVVISAESALRNARRYHNTKYGELALCVTHGILHLRGYTDTSAMKKREMMQKQNRILNRLYRDGTF
jgi:probable rRNA maturation factor